jgi:hypothetical protein
LDLKSIFVVSELVKLAVALLYVPVEQGDVVHVLY